MPPEVARVFGDAGPKFVDFLGDVLSTQADEVQQMSVLSFEKTLTREISAVRLEMAELRAETQSSIAELRTDMAELRADFQTSQAENKTAIAELRSDMHQQISAIHGEISGIHGQISGLHGEISGLHEKISDVHKQISNQTKWLLAMMLAAVTIYPIVNQLVQRYL